MIHAELPWQPRPAHPTFDDRHLAALCERLEETWNAVNGRLTTVQQEALRCDGVLDELERRVAEARGGLTGTQKG